MIISENTCTSYIRRTLAFGYEIGTKKCDLYTSNYGIYMRRLLVFVMTAI